MTFEGFKNIHMGDTPLEMLRQMQREHEHWRSDAKARVRASCNGNDEEAAYWDCECAAMQERVDWLTQEIAAALKAQEPEPTRLVRHYSRPNVYADLWLHCEKCGGKVDDRYRPKHCPECGRTVKWE
jgi:rubrerythrin